MLTRKPVKGDRVRWPHWPKDRIAVVVRVEGNLCWIREDGSDEAHPFLWQFPRTQTLNELAELVEPQESPAMTRKRA